MCICFSIHLSLYCRLAISFRSSIRDDLISDIYPSLSKLNKYLLAEASSDTITMKEAVESEEVKAESAEPPPSPAADTKPPVALLRHLPQELKPLTSGLLQVFYSLFF